jgi:hypothetical protein
MRRMKTLLFLGVVGVAGFLLLLVLLDVQVSGDSVVSEDESKESLEMSVMLMPIEEMAAEPEMKPEVIVGEPIPEETPPLPREQPPQQRPRPVPAADDADAAGRFPALVASYAGAGGLRAHLMALRALGARTFVADMDEQQLVAEVDPSNWSLSKDFVSLSGLALDRSRLIDDDRNVEAIIRSARSLYGYGNFVFVLLMPRAVENRILRGLDHAFKKIGRPANEFVSVHGSYAHSGRRLSLSVVDARDRRGRSVALSTDILLGP